MHNVKENGGRQRAPTRARQVGIPGNDVPAESIAGTYLGSSNIEGFQAGNFIQILDNQAAQWLLQLTTADGRRWGASPAWPTRWLTAPAALRAGSRRRSR